MSIPTGHVDDPHDADPPLLHAALTAAARGHAVLPLWPRSKRPVFTGWENAATTDPLRIRELWTATPFNLLTGLARNTPRQEQIWSRLFGTTSA
ncbi:bifunctional DNA primase/polymerase, partial [Saccharopolyspora sp. 6V]|uniref:bifunctional DNA primase/polymerase n=1 Tax=Saccharopolyspora sp. 6V TaxID=2877239 RepID=UPI001CD76A9B